MSDEISPDEPQHRWLSDDELRTWFAVNSLLARVPAALDSSLQRRSGLSYVEYYVLAGLADQPSRSMRMGQLAMFAHARPSRLSHLTARLEKRGLVRRDRDPADGRSTLAVLTEAGLQALVDAAPGHVAQVCDLVFDALSESAQHTLREAAETIVGRLQDSPGRQDEL